MNNAIITEPRRVSGTVQELVLHVLSLGAGVQSSTMALMAARGELTPMPECAIFADTQAEPASVYRWLDWLEKQLPFPVHRVTAGNIVDTISTPRQKKDKSGWWVRSGIPAFVLNPDGTRGMIPRQCTADFKIAPIRRALRTLRGKRPVVQWIGISLDECHRMKPSRDKWCANIWPLVDQRMSRNDCLRWMEAKGFPRPPRSACVFCPFHSDAEWRRLKTDEPDEFAKAVAVEKAFQVAKRVGRVRGEVFLHASRVPLGDVDFSTDVDNGQGLLLGNECEGMCGL